MALADTNFWIALTFSGHGHHQAARAWLAGQRGAESALFCRSTQQSFLRLITTAAVCRPLGVPPLGNRDAWSVFEGFAADPRVGWADEPPGLAGVVEATVVGFRTIAEAVDGRLPRRLRAGGPAWHRHNGQGVQAVQKRCGRPAGSNLSRLRSRQPQRELRPVVRLALDLDLAAVGFNDLARDRQSQAGAPGFG